MISSLFLTNINVRSYKRSKKAIPFIGICFPWWLTLSCCHPLLLCGYTYPIAPCLLIVNPSTRPTGDRWKKVLPHIVIAIKIANIRIWIKSTVLLVKKFFFPFWLLVSRTKNWCCLIHLNGSFNLVISKLSPVIKILSQYNHLSSFCRAFSLKFQRVRFIPLPAWHLYRARQSGGGIELSES